MPTTTNNGWTTPADTDLIKNGASAIRTLGQAIDTTLGVYSASTPIGVKINTTTFSAAASQSFNNVFSATYQNYKIILIASMSASGTLGIRFRVGGTDNSTALSYGTQYMYSTGTGNVQAGNESAAQAIIGSANGTAISGYAQLEIFNPFNTVNTGYMSLNQSDNTGAVVRMGYHNQNTSYDGFTITPSTGTMTGTIRVYGYNN